jgi:hypothetical protein
MIELVEYIKFYFSLYGFMGGLKFFFNLLICGEEKIYIFDIKKDTHFEKTFINPELEFKFIENRQEFDKIEKDYASVKGKRLARKDRRRVEAGREYLGVVYKSGVFAGWGWVKAGPLKYGNSSLAKNECVIHKCRTLRNFRRQRVYATLLLSLMKNLRHRHFNNIYIGAKSFNIPSLRAIEKVGFNFIEEFDAGSFIGRILNHLKGSGSKVLKG